MRKQLLIENTSGLDHKDWVLLKSLRTPAKIQDFLNSLHFDHDPGHSINRSVRGVLESGKADCAGGAILAAAALWANGEKPLLLDLAVSKPDFDHVVALFKRHKKWGAISKTNHAVLRFREAIYRDVRELTMSYFHEYFLPNGKKTLRRYSKPFDLSKYGTKWLTDGDLIQEIIFDLDHSKHEEIISPFEARQLRLADKIEVKAGEIVEDKR